jgi:Holliday junction resolvase
MTNPPKRRGDQAEREVTQLLNDHLGLNARRAFGAGRGHDEGDIVGVPYTAIQVAARTTRVADAIRHKPNDAEKQRVNAHVPFAATFLRLRGGSYRVVLTPEQFFTLWREAINGKR